MKRYFKTVIALVILVTLIRGCKDDGYEERHANSGVTPFTVDTNTTIPTMTDDEIAEDIQRRVLPENLYVYVNEDVYTNMRVAKQNFENLFDGGTIASQMRSCGTNVSEDRGKFINENMNALYDYICEYIDAYQVKNYERCYEYALKVYNVGVDQLNKKFLYDTVVGSKLPSGYNGDIDFNHYDSNGNICLNNGKQVFLLGGRDLVVCPDEDIYNTYQAMYSGMEWVKNLPQMLVDQYCVVESSTGSNGVCYFWNESNVARVCRKEWEALRQSGSELYGISPKDVRVLAGDDTYMFATASGTLLGSLSPENSARVSHIYEVQDTMVSHKGDIQVLDTLLRNMYVAQANNTYYK